MVRNMPGARTQWLREELKISVEAHTIISIKAKEVFGKVQYYSLKEDWRPPSTWRSSQKAEQADWKTPEASREPFPTLSHRCYGGTSATFSQNK